MRSKSSGSFFHPIIGLGNSFLLNVVMVVLPRIDISLPHRRRVGEEKNPQEEGGDEHRLVMWEDRKITLFDHHLLIPTISIEFPLEDEFTDLEFETKDMMVLREGALLPEDQSISVDETAEAIPFKMTPDIELPLPPSQDEVEESISDTIMERKEDSICLESLPVCAPILEVEEKPIYDGPTESIAGGAMVLVEGERGRGTCAALQAICLGFLENGRSVTYVTTSMSVQDLIMEMHQKDQRIADYLPDHRLLCVPVYPLMEGKGASDDLLDKLMTSEQLQTSDVIIVDSLTDFLSDQLNEAICVRLLEYIQHLNGMGKIVILAVKDGQKGILPLRLETELHLSLHSGKEDGIQLKRYLQSREGAEEMLRFHIDATAGLLVHPLPSDPS